jgi:hypothetical protein
MFAQINPVYYVLSVGLLVMAIGRSRRDRLSGAAIVALSFWLLSVSG